MPPTTSGFELAFAEPAFRPTPAIDDTSARTSMVLAPPWRPIYFLNNFIRYFPLLSFFDLLQTCGNFPPLRMCCPRATKEYGSQVKFGNLRCRTVHVIGAGNENVHEVRVLDRAFDVLFYDQHRGTR